MLCTVEIKVGSLKPLIQAVAPFTWFEVTGVRVEVGVDIGAYLLFCLSAAYLGLHILSA